MSGDQIRHAIRSEDSSSGLECTCGFSGSKTTVLDHITERSESQPDDQGEESSDNAADDAADETEYSGSSWVSPDECQRMRDLARDDVSSSTIADRLDLYVGTVPRHVYGRCGHDDDGALDPSGKQCPYCNDAIRSYALHLPCEESP